MWVVKLGGSLADSDLLPLWLEALAECPGVVVVPGGGPFADAVREAQVRWAFSEQIAHDMAILGMRQYGLMLADLGGLPMASEPAELLEWRDRCAVWLPLPKTLNAAGICASWDVTSDSIAAWLAARLEADNLLLIKHASFSQPALECGYLAGTGVVDAGFESYFSRCGCSGWIAGVEDHDHLAAALAAPSEHFLRIA